MTIIPMDTVSPCLVIVTEITALRDAGRRNDTLRPPRHVVPHVPTRAHVTSRAAGNRFPVFKTISQYFATAAKTPLRYFEGEGARAPDRFCHFSVLSVLAGPARVLPLIESITAL